MAGTEELATRLRTLRTTALGTSITQGTLGKIIGVSAPLISSWETGAAVPTEDRLRAYALFFAGNRSIERKALLAADDLTPEEEARRHDLLAELTALAPVPSEDETTATPDPADADFWHFPDGHPVRIVCGALKSGLPPFAEPGHRNYIALSAVADLDALVELHGHLRSRNPTSDVRLVLPSDVTPEDLHSHLVLLGNVARTQSDISGLIPADFPVRQREDPAVVDGEVFVVGTGSETRTIRPVLAPEGSAFELRQDIGFLARMRSSPADRDRTLTICSGVFTRGVHGAVLSTTDDQVAAANAAYLRSRFAGADVFGVLMRVPVAGRFTPTPRLDDVRTRLFEFP